MITKEEMELRSVALQEAREIVAPIIEDFKPEPYRVTHSPAIMLSTPAGTTVTPAETVARLYMDVAEWLLKEHRD